MHIKEGVALANTKNNRFLGYPLLIWPNDEEDGYVAAFPDLPGCIACAKTWEELPEAAWNAQKESINQAIHSGQMILPQDPRHILSMRWAAAGGQEILEEMIGRWCKSCEKDQSSEEMLEEDLVGPRYPNRLRDVISSPGEILQEEFLEPLGISRSQLAEAIGKSESTIAGIIDGSRAIDLEYALLLGRTFSVSAEFWLNLQMDYDLKLADRTICDQVKVLVYRTR